MADHREQVRGDTPPGALAKAVIFTTEPVGSACMRFAGDQREQVSPDTGPGLEKIGECGKIEKNKSGFEC